MIPNELIKRLQYIEIYTDSGLASFELWRPMIPNELIKRLQYIEIYTDSGLASFELRSANDPG